MSLLLLCQSVLITLISYPIAIPVCIFFVIYRYLISLLLSIKLGEKYGGLLPTSDCLFFTNGASKVNLTDIVILKSDRKRDILKEVKREAQKKLFDNPDDYPKFTGTLDIFCGYPYLVKNACKLEECVIPLPVPEHKVFNEECLKEVTGELANKPFPHNDKALWQISVSEKPLERNKNDKCYYYALVFKCDHAVADGVLLMTFVSKFLADDSTEMYIENRLEDTHRTRQEKVNFMKLFLKNIKKYVNITMYVLFMGLGRFLQQNYLRSADKHALHGPVPSGEKIVAWSVEEKVEFIPLVKKIRQRTNSKFSSVILTAISASFTNFFRRNSLQVPEAIIMALPVQMDFPKLDPTKPVPLENQFVFLNLEIDSHRYSLLETLTKMTNKLKDIKAADIKISRSITKRVGILPINVIKMLPNFEKETCIVSNVPGGPKVTLLGGCVAENIIPFTPNCNKIGISLSLLTYGDMFQAGVLVDKTLMASQKEAQKFVDDIFYYIKMFDKELDDREN